MYSHFSDRARTVMQLANDEAKLFKHEYIGTEHVLLGLLSQGTGVAANVLKNLDIDLKKARRAVESIIQVGPEPAASGIFPTTPRAKRVVEYAIEESRELGYSYVGTEHLLLGLLREHEGVAAQVLMNLGLSLSRVRNEVLQLLGQSIPVVPNPESTSRSAAPELLLPAHLADLPPMIGAAVLSLDLLADTLQSMKEVAISRQDFEWAADVRDQGHKLRKMREWLLRNMHKEP